MVIFISSNWELSLTFSIKFYFCIINITDLHLYYSETCLIRHALGDKFCVGIDRVSDCTVLKTREIPKWERNLTSKFTVCRIIQVLDKTVFTVLYAGKTLHSILFYTFFTSVRSFGEFKIRQN